MTTLNTSNTSIAAQLDAEEEYRFLREQYGENWEEPTVGNPFLTERDTPMTKEFANLINPAIQIVIQAAVEHNWEEARAYKKGMNARASMNEKDWSTVVETANRSWYSRLIIEQALTNLYKNIYTNTKFVTLSMFHGDLVLRLTDGSEEVFERPLQD